MPIPDEMPDYSKYTLGDLYEVAQRFARERDDKCYAVACREIARREGAPYKNEPYRLSKWRDWLFEPGNQVRTPRHIIAWWEMRRSFWNGFVAFLGFCAAGTLALLWLTMIFHAQSFSWEAIGSIALMALLTLFCAFIFWVFALIPINIVFCFAYFLDILLSVPLRFLGWRLSVGLFVTLLAATILLAVYPVLIMIIGIVRQ